MFRVMRTCGAIVIASLALACGGAQHAGPPAAPPLELRTYAPLAMSADANAPHHAVILGTDERDRSTLLPLVAAPRLPLAAAAALNKDAAVVAAATLETIAALASATGAVLDHRATVLGYVNPDGTLAPEPGLSDRARAAAANGVQRIGDPKVIADLAEAYAFITGKALPASLPVDERDMTVDATTAAALVPRFARWQQLVAIEWSGILQLESAGRVPSLLSRLRSNAKRFAEAAETSRARGNIAAAHGQMVSAWIAATTANRIYDVLALVQRSDVPGALALIDSLGARDATAADPFTALAAATPETIAGHLQWLAAARFALHASNGSATAGAALDDVKATLRGLASLTPAEITAEAVADQVVSTVEPWLTARTHATADALRAVEQLELAAGRSASYAPDVAKLVSLYTGLAGHAPDHDGMLGFAALELEVSLTARSAALRNAVAADAADPRALATMLKRAARAARARARAARVATGVIPLAAKLPYQHALAKMSGTTEDKLEALSLFWIATEHAQLAITLARN